MAVIRISLDARDGTMMDVPAGMIFGTHDPTEIPSTVTNLLVLDSGRLRHAGPRADWHGCEWKRQGHRGHRRIETGESKRFLERWRTLPERGTAPRWNGSCPAPCPSLRSLAHA
jgi:hypothetical protein